MNILFTICGRAGSKGVKSKNSKEMNGVPLVFYTLASIKAYKDAHSEHNIKTALNTDSVKLIEQIDNQKILPEIIKVERKQEFADDIVPKVEAIKDTYLVCAKSQSFDVVIDLDITSPMRRLQDIEAAIEEYDKNTDYDLVFSVVPSRRSPYFSMVEKKDTGYFGKIYKANYTARQQLPATYDMNASIYVYNPQFLSSKIEKTILDYKCGIVVMPDYLVLDIDSEEDFRMMEVLYQYYCKYDNDLNYIKTIAENFDKSK